MSAASKNAGRAPAANAQAGTDVAANVLAGTITFTPDATPTKRTRPAGAGRKAAPLDPNLVSAFNTMIKTGKGVVTLTFTPGQFATIAKKSNEWLESKGFKTSFTVIDTDTAPDGTVNTVTKEMTLKPLAAEIVSPVTNEKDKVEVL
jgi:hypothetical protein